MNFREAASNLALGLRAALRPSARLVLRQNFDRARYLQAYPDVAASRWPPLLHYLWHGHREMRDPGPSFSGVRYLRIHQDVRREGLCPLLHYAVFGIREDRLIGPSARFGLVENLRGTQARVEMEQWPANRPLVSVIVPCFNYGRTLARCLDSLGRQTFRDFEVLVIEGGSTDPDSVARTKELERECRANTRFLYRSSPCMVGDNRNFGIAAAKGKYVCCLDADDMLHPAFLETCVFVAEAEDFDIVSPSVRCFGDSRMEWLLQAPSIEKLARANCISTAALFRKQVWEKTGGYRDWGRGADHVPEDWDFWIRALGLGFRATALAAPLHLYSVHDGALSREGDPASFQHKLVEANRDLLDSPHPVRVACHFTDPLVNMRRASTRSSSPPSMSARGVLFCMPWITVGGAENNLRAIAIALIQAGVQVAVITTAELLPGMSDETERFESSGCVVYNLPDLLTNVGLWQTFIEELLYRHNVETIFQCGSEFIYGLLPVLREQHSSLRVVDQLFLDEGHVATNRRFASFIDLTLVPSISLRNILAETYGESPAKFRLVPHALLPSFDDNAALDRGLLETMRGKFVVSFVGRFSPEKAPALFLELAFRLSANPDYFFLLVGDGPLRQKVVDSARTLKGRFHAPGAVWNARAYIAASNVVVVPSKLEGLPGVVLESLAAGRPVVATRVGAIPEVIVHGVNGFLCDYGDMDGFFACVERLRTDAALRASIEANAKESARGDFGFDAMMEAYRAILAPTPPQNGELTDMMPGTQSRPSRAAISSFPPCLAGVATGPSAADDGEPCYLPARSSAIGQVMKIAFYSPDRHILYDGSTPENVGVGGGITVRIRAAAALAALGHDVQVICNCAERVVCDGVDYKPLDSVRTISADIVIAQASGGARDLTPLILLPVEARLRVLLLSGVDEPKAWEAFQPQLINACSEYVASAVWESWSPRPGKIFVCPYGTTLQTPVDWPARDLHSVVYTSHPSKGLAAAIQVIRLLRQHDPAWNLHIFGGNRLWGGNDEPVEEGGVKYHGLVSQSFLRQDHPRFSFSLHLQRRLEPFGLTLVESMAAGCVAIASPAGAYSEIIEHGRNGFLVAGDPESPETQQAAAALIRNLADSPDEIARISQAARSSTLSWETIARAWETWWRSELAPPASDGIECTGCHGVLLRTPAGYHCQKCGKYRRLTSGEDS